MFINVISIWNFHVNILYSFHEVLFLQLIWDSIMYNVSCIP